MSLISTLTSGVSALRSFSTGLQNIGNDIANVSTTSYKKAHVSFADTFAGIGVQATGVSTSFTQGSLESTGNVTDLGVSGNGFFIVKDASGNQYATRDGSFHFDTNGNLVNSQGYKLQGFTGGASTGPTTPPTAVDTSTVADVKLATPPGAAQLKSVNVDTAGQITEFYSDGSSAVTGQVLLQNFSNLSGLTKQGNNLYGGLDTAGPVGGTTVFGNATLTTYAPNANGLGSIQSGTLEQSNVDLTEEFSNMITMQRSFQAGSRLITISDSVLEDIVNLKQR
jgi:flagellar hook protein FlgE